MGWDINVHVPCVHTWMLRCCYVRQCLGVGWGVLGNYRWCALRTHVDASLLLRHWFGFGWGWVNSNVHDLGLAAASTSGKPPRWERATSLVGIWVGLALYACLPTSMVAISIYGDIRCPMLPYTDLWYYSASCHTRLQPLVCEPITCHQIQEYTWDVTLLLHTSGIDGMWKLSKGAVPTSWSTRKDGAVNPQLLQGIGIWQRRWHHGNCTDFLRLTGHALSKRLEK